MKRSSVLDGFDGFVFAMKKIRQAAEEAFAPAETAVMLGQGMDRDERSVRHESVILARGTAQRFVARRDAQKQEFDRRECLSHLGKKAHRQECLCYWLLDGFGLGDVSEELQNAALEFGGLEADGGGVEGAGDFPEFPHK